MQNPVHAGVDLGAGSGRVLVGGFADGVFLEEAHRFRYAPRPSAGHLRWDFTRLVDGMLDGLCRAASVAGARDLTVRSVGVDSWGVDYGLVDVEGDLVEEPICYRDSRTEGMMERAFAQVSRETLFRETGVQMLPINTIFQLMAHVREGLPASAERLLMIPDLCHQALCGASTSEPTNASTTQLLNLATADWDDRLFSELDLPRHLMPRLRPSGTTLGPLRDHLRERLQLADAVVVQPATHDTASAVAGTPLAPGWAFISSGTWSLVGVERKAPLVEPAVLAGNFTNERGIGGTFRFLKNVAGLWILECCRREWQTSGRSEDLPRLLAEAAALGQPQSLVYPDDPRFFNPPSMLRELRQALTETGQRVPATPAEWTRVVLDSLACRYASLIDTLEGLTGQPLAGIHIVGGGARNEYLNQATASAAGRPVLAGPFEATALGNLLVQAVACGITTLAEGRRRIAEAFPPRRFEPADAVAWRAAARQYEALERTAGTEA